jgi:hypothetical protein
MSGPIDLLLKIVRLNAPTTQETKLSVFLNSLSKELIPAMMKTSSMAG